MSYVFLKVDLATKKLIGGPARISRGGPRPLRLSFVNGSTPTMLPEGATIVLELYVPDDLENAIPGSVLSAWSRNTDAGDYSGTLNTGGNLLGGLAYPTLFGRIKWIEPAGDVIQTSPFHVIYGGESIEGTDKAILWEQLTNIPSSFPAQTPLPITAGAVTFSGDTVAGALTRLDNTVALSLRSVAIPSTSDQRTVIQAVFDATKGVITIPRGSWTISSGTLEVPSDVTLRGDGGVIKVTGSAQLLFNGRAEGASQIFELDSPDQLRADGLPVCGVGSPVWFDQRAGENASDAWHGLQCACKIFRSVEVPGRYSVSQPVVCKIGLAIWGPGNFDHRAADSDRHYITRTSNEPVFVSESLPGGGVPTSHNGIRASTSFYGVCIKDTRTSFNGESITAPLLSFKNVGLGRMWCCRVEGPVYNENCRYELLHSHHLQDFRITDSVLIGGGSWTDDRVPSVFVGGNDGVVSGAEFVSNEVHFLGCHFEGFNGAALVFADQFHSCHVTNCKFESSQCPAEGRFLPPVVIAENGSAFHMSGCYILAGQNEGMFNAGLLKLDRLYGATVETRIDAKREISWSQDGKVADHTLGLVVGQKYRIENSPGADATNVGAETNDVGTIFTAQGGEDGDYVEPASWGSNPTFAFRRIARSDQCYISAPIVVRGAQTGTNILAFCGSNILQSYALGQLHSLLEMQSVSGVFPAATSVYARNMAWGVDVRGNPDRLALLRVYPDPRLAGNTIYASVRTSPLIINTYLDENSNSNFAAPSFGAGGGDRIWAIDPKVAAGIATQLDFGVWKHDFRGSNYQDKDLWEVWDLQLAKVLWKKPVKHEAQLEVKTTAGKPLVIYNPDLGTTARIYVGAGNHVFIGPGTSDPYQQITT